MTVSKFKGEGKWLSNFEPSPVHYDDVEYPTVEHAYQAAKTLDPAERAAILACKTPGDARRLGQKVTFRPNWELMKISVMYILVLEKFVRHEHLRQKLLDTGDHHLIEDSTGWNDRFWGVSDGYGRNHLGRILMDVREELQMNMGASALGAIYREVEKYHEPMSMVNEAKERLHHSELRRMEQASEIMALQADNSTLATEVATLRGYAEQCYRDGQGHNHCWRNVERMFEQFGLQPKRRGLPPLDEFKQGCEAFQCELYKTPERWPDFIEGAEKNDEST